MGTRGCVFKRVGGGARFACAFMAIKLRTLDGQELVVFPDRCEILFRDRLYQNPRVWNLSNRVCIVNEDVFRQRLPAIATVRVMRPATLGVDFPVRDGLRVNGRVFWSMYLDAHAVTVQDVNLIGRFIRSCLECLRMRKRKLAVGMMTHARLGEACALNRFPEVVKMVMEAL